MEHAHDTAVESAAAQRLLEVLQQTDWADLTPRLLAYASYRLARHGQARGRYSKTAHDFVQEAITLTLTGKRHFPLKSELSLFGFLCGITDSLISHEAERARRVTLVSTDNADASNESDGAFELPTYEIEREIVAKDEAEHFIASLEADLQAYVRLRVYGDCSTAEEYARALNTTVAQIRNFDRRLRRRRNQI